LEPYAAIAGGVPLISSSNQRVGCGSAGAAVENVSDRPQCGGDEGAKKHQDHNDEDQDPK